MLADDIERLVRVVAKTEREAKKGPLSFDTIRELEDAKRNVDYWYERLENYIGNVSDVVSHG